MKTKTQLKKEFGDFQTPPELSDAMIVALIELGIRPTVVIEPTCGLGTVLLDACDQFKPRKAIGIEINGDYCDILREKLEPGTPISVIHGDIFVFLRDTANDIVPDDLCLLVGNPPWVTNSELGTLDSRNVPAKRNAKNLRGIDAITGKSNFDIAEYIIVELIKTFRLHRAVHAFLCKTSVARNVLNFCWEQDIGYKEAHLFPIDAKKHFNAAVDACFFVLDASEKTSARTCNVYDSLETKTRKYGLGLRGGTMVRDTETVATRDYLGQSDRVWRNGVKHDCSKVMEFDKIGQAIVNGYGERVDVEDDLLYPLLKSSDLANGRIEPRKQVLVTQRRIGEDTGHIRHAYPKTWRYLMNHLGDFEKRKSDIYKNKPLFSIFSIGDYSFAPWKIAVSGLYKNIRFEVLGPVEGKPVMVDDTCNFLSCDTEDEARLLHSLLMGKDVEIFLNSLIFRDSKRPVTTRVLNSLDLRKVADTNGLRESYDALNDHDTVTAEKSSVQLALF